MAAFSSRMIVESSMAVAVAMRRGCPARHPFAAEIAGSEDCNDRFFPLLGKHDNLHFTFLDVENRIRRLALRKDNLMYFIG